MNNVLGHRHATRPHVGLDTSDLEGCKGSDDQGNSQAVDVEGDTPRSPTMLILNDNEGSSSSAVGEISSSENASRAYTPTVPEDTRKKGKGKRGSVKRTREERMKDAIESVFTSVMIEMQKSDEDLLTALEEKRMKFDENRLTEERQSEEK